MANDRYGLKHKTLKAVPKDYIGQDPDVYDAPQVFISRPGRLKLVRANLALPLRTSVATALVSEIH